ncbi:MAG: PorP/SprF family type IX secretion system membrane protein [Bacteroidales bacterium]|nr:PorP/SprF family type IX secretion system membrane protein [Bacteroidales bacterium]
MKKPSVIFLFILLAGSLFSQQEPQYNQHMFTRAIVNPAAAGISQAVDATLIGRHQWIGYKDNDSSPVYPKLYGISLDMPIYAIHSGVGLNLRHYTAGAEKSLDIRLQYAYHFTLNKRNTLSFGMSFNLLNKTIDYSQLLPAEFDPLLESSKAESGLVTDIGLGIHYRYGDKFNAGISSASLLGNSAGIGGPDFKLERHYYGYGSYDIEIQWSGEALVLTPGFLVKTARGAFNADIYALVTYNDFIWGGMMYRVESAAAILAGISYNGIKAGVSYDYTMSKGFAAGSRHSVELFVKYSYPISPKVVKRSGYNTRNL